MAKKRKKAKKKVVAKKVKKKIGKKSRKGSKLYKARVKALAKARAAKAAKAKNGGKVPSVQQVRDGFDKELARRLKKLRPDWFEKGKTSGASKKDIVRLEKKVGTLSKRLDVICKALGL